MSVLSTQLTDNVRKSQVVEEQSKSMSEMRKQISMLLSIMSAQTVVLFVMMVLVAYLFKDQFVGENGVLRDGEGNPILTGSADFQVNSNGELAPSQLNGRRLAEGEGDPVVTMNKKFDLDCGMDFSDIQDNVKELQKQRKDLRE